MTNSARSGSEPPTARLPPAWLPPAAPSRAYELYHPAVQRWIYDRGWDRLRDVQERATALYVSPLKALVNDQYDRIVDLVEPLDLPAYRWHGDAPASGKARVLRAPAGLLLITPESLEALFVRHGDRVRRVFGGLRYVI